MIERVALYPALLRDEWLDAKASRELRRVDAEIEQAHHLANLGIDIAAAQYHEDLLHWRMRAVWSIRWQSLFREVSQGRLVVYGRAALSSQHKLWEGAAWGDARDCDPEILHLAFPDGSRIYNVLVSERTDIIDASDDRRPTATRNGRRRGRPPGSGSLAMDDDKLLEEMRAILSANPALSSMSAAMRVAYQAAGAGTPESKAKRLVKRYSEMRAGQSKTFC